MDKVYIIFWTQSGNTGAMATAIGDGVKASGKEAVFLSPSEANISVYGAGRNFVDMLVGA